VLPEWSRQHCVPLLLYHYLWSSFGSSGNIFLSFEITPASQAPWSSRS
jgi:hypothetical protein